MMLWIAIAVAVVLLGLAVWNPYLFRMGWSHAKARPMQTLAVMLGLGTAMGVLLGGAVAGDSSAEVLEAYQTRLHKDVDLVIDNSWAQADKETLRTEVERVAPGSQVALATIYHMELDAVAGSSTDFAWVLGVDEANLDVTDWEVVEGSLDAWKTGAVLTQHQARDLHTHVGDTLVVYDEVSGQRRAYATHQFSEKVVSQSGALFLAGEGPSGPVHSDRDEYKFNQTANPQLYTVEVAVDPDEATYDGLYMELTSPNGTVARQAIGAGGAAIRLEGNNSYLEHGDFQLEVHATAATQVTFSVTWRFTTLHGVPPWEQVEPGPLVYELPVVAVVKDHASPVHPDAVLLHEDLPEAHGSLPWNGGIRYAYVDLPSGTSASEAAEALRDVWPGDFAVRDLAQDRADRLESAKTEMMIVWGVVGSMTLAAGVALIFVLMGLMVEERRSSLATLRASGATPLSIASMHLAEALVYGLLALVPALVLGLILAAILDIPIAPEESRLVVRPVTLLLGAAVAIALVLFGSAIAAFRSGRLHIPSALRGQEKPVAGASWPRWVGVGLFGLLALAQLPGLIEGSVVALIVGPAALVMAAALLAATWLPRHVVLPGAATLMIFWLIVTRNEVGQFSSAAEVLLLPLRALMFCGAAAILFAYAAPVHRGLGWLWSRSRFGVPIESALAYLRGRPGRAAMTLFVLCLVLLGVTFLGAVVPSEGEQWYNMGGYDAFGHANEYVEDLDAYLALNPPEEDPWRNVAKWEQTVWLEDAGTLWHGQGGNSPNEVMAVTPELIHRATFATIEGPSMAKAVSQVLSRPNTAIMAVWSVQESPHHVGDMVRFEGDHGEQEVEIIALMRQGAAPNIWTSAETLETLAANQGTEPVSMVWIESKNGHTAEEVAWEVEQEFADIGLRLFPQNTDEITPAIITMFSVFTIMTLTIGAVALGIITARNAMVRRRQIGAMRALGAQQSQVVAMVMAESVYIVAVAVVFGILGASLSLAGLSDFIPITMPWAWVLSLGAYAIVAAAVAGLLPALAAARMDPAEAARYVE